MIVKESPVDVEISSSFAAACVSFVSSVSDDGLPHPVRIEAVIINVVISNKNLFNLHFSPFCYYFLLKFQTFLI